MFDTSIVGLQISADQTQYMQGTWYHIQDTWYTYNMQKSIACKNQSVKFIYTPLPSPLHLPLGWTTSNDEAIEPFWPNAQPDITKG